MSWPVAVTRLVRGVCCNRRRLVPPSGRAGGWPCGAALGIWPARNNRTVCTTRCLQHGEYEWQDPKSEDEIVRVVFVNKDGKRTEVKGKIGDNVLYLAHRYCERRPRHRADKPR